MNRMIQFFGGFKFKLKFKLNIKMKEIIILEFKILFSF